MQRCCSTSKSETPVVASAQVPPPIRHVLPSPRRPRATMVCAAPDRPWSCPRAACQTAKEGSHRRSPHDNALIQSDLISSTESTTNNLLRPLHVHRTRHLSRSHRYRVKGISRSVQLNRAFRQYEMLTITAYRGRIPNAGPPVDRRLPGPRGKAVLMFEAIRIPPGHYAIGDESVPNAAPSHRRRLWSEFWIDATPVSWSHYEVFVAAGSYAREDFWTEHIAGGGKCPAVASVDKRCEAIFEATVAGRVNWPEGAQKSRDLPVMGLSWYEAFAVARFYHARLPFEAEWEGAMSRHPDGNERLSRPQGPWPDCVASRFGCFSLHHVMEEWMADAFSPRYWRADFNKRGVEWKSGSQVSVRGASPNELYQHQSFRFGDKPESASPFRGFRRVWDREPSAADVSALWRQDAG